MYADLLKLILQMFQILYGLQQQHFQIYDFPFKTLYGISLLQPFIKAYIWRLFQHKLQGTTRLRFHTYIEESRKSIAHNWFSFCIEPSIHLRKWYCFSIICILGTDVITCRTCIYFNWMSTLNGFAYEISLGVEKQARMCAALNVNCMANLRYFKVFSHLNGNNTHLRIHSGTRIRVKINITGNVFNRLFNPFLWQSFSEWENRRKKRMCTNYQLRMDKKSHILQFYVQLQYIFLFIIHIRIFNGGGERNPQKTALLFATNSV